jgi:hypothetical protein
MLEAIKSVVLSALSGDAQRLLLVGAIYMLLVCGYSCVYQMKMRGWPATDGKLKKAAIEKFGATKWPQADQQYVGSAVYEYDIAGRTYEGTKISPWIIIATHNLKSVLRHQLSKIVKGSDGEIAVYYNPRKPDKSVLIRPGLLGLALTVVIGGAPMALYLVKYGVGQ